VRKKSRKIKLQEQPFRLLALLVQRPGEVVTREELQQALWPADTFVEFDHGLNTAIKKIRQALDDSAETPQFIETLPRQGYRFIGSPEWEPDRRQEPKRAKGVRLGLFVGAIALAIGLAAFWMRSTSGRRSPAADELSIAVLPFTNLSSDTENEYFAFGLREELIQALSNVEHLLVIKSAGKAEDVPEIARKLNVRAVLAGSVRKSGGQIRISANLIDASVGRLLWSETYNREFKDVFAIQEGIARAIVETLDLRLAGAQSKRLVRNSSVNLEAYSLYLKGRYTLNTAADAEVTKKAMRYFEQAIARDSSYAPAYTGLGDSYDELYNAEALPPVEALAGRRKAAQKALELDPTLPEAIATRGGVAVEDWDWPTAERCFRRAIELKPNDTTTHCWYGLVLGGLGRYDEAVTEAKRAKELDPLFQEDRLMSQILYWDRRYDKALEHLRKILELHPSAPCVHGLRGTIYLLQGEKESALAELTTAAELTGHSSSAESYLGQAYAMCGRRAEAQQILQALIARSKERYVGSLNIARIYAGLGDRDNVFESLDRAYRKGESEWPLALADPMWDSLRSDPRFTVLLKRIGLKN
jgi:TolB-like protein/DNA-binding winged helix-turn-helix (wHTH) protein/Flp pilus assembly protein TadD